MMWVSLFVVVGDIFDCVVKSYLSLIVLRLLLGICGDVDRVFVVKVLLVIFGNLWVSVLVLLMVLSVKLLCWVSCL